MTEKSAFTSEPQMPEARVSLITEISKADMIDLCDATVTAIENGGGFGWVVVPERDVLERFWRGVLAMPQRHLFVARLDDVICGTAQLVLPPHNNEAQSHAVHLTSTFLTPWARGYGLAKKLVEAAERKAKQDHFKVINLDVRETQQEAINLFETQGYKQCGIHPFYAYVDEKPVKGYYYYKLL
ncbi:MAG: GNAT family N-acetyltransferase [Micavibrio sp.]|nr:GNAT family N-acetyltransferase [Micavibrio sp.]|tara:strand:- start:966 stop:1517 length:552 start_codon:yes stop_codon:yes gene_type:complete